MVMFTDFRLEVFRAVARTGSFTAAAKAMGVTQPAISQNISQLEQMLGEKLFERGRGNVTLTEKGREFEFYADKILYWYGQAQSVMVDKTAQEKAALSLELSDGRSVTVKAEDDEIKIKVSYL